MRTSKGNGQALPFPMHEMGGIPNANASTDQCEGGNLSFYLGGKAPSDPETWTPNMEAVQATIKFTLATGQLNINVEQATNTPQQ
jgi:hypothetical protein